MNEKIDLIKEPTVPDKDPYKVIQEIEENLTPTQKEMSKKREEIQNNIEEYGHTGKLSDDTTRDDYGNRTRTIKGSFDGEKIDFVVDKPFSGPEKFNGTINEKTVDPEIIKSQIAYYEKNGYLQGGIIEGIQKNKVRKELDELNKK